MSAPDFGSQIGDDNAAGGVGLPQESSGDAASPAVPDETDPYEKVWSASQDQNIPEPFLQKFRDTARPVLDEMRKGYEDQLEAYKQYEEFVKAGIPRDHLVMGYRFLQRANTDPAGVVESLSTYMQNQGIPAKQAQAAAEQAVGDQQQQDSSQDQDLDYSDTPQMRAMKAQLDEQNQTLAEIQQEKLSVKAEKELEKELREVETAHAASPISSFPLSHQALFDRIQAQLFRGQEPSLKGAYASWSQEVISARNFPTSGSQAPKVLSSSAGGAGNAGMPLNRGAKIPDDILNGSNEILNKWVKEVWLPGRQSQAG